MSNLSNNLHTQLARLSDKYEINHDLTNHIAEGRAPISDIEFLIESKQMSSYDAKVFRQIAVSA